MKRLFYIPAVIALVASTAHAQLAINPPAAKQYVCFDKKDAYALAIADMQGTLAIKWHEFVQQGRCAVIPATFLYTIDTYTDVDHVSSRVVELLAYGERVWGIRSTLPKTGVWVI